MAWVVETVGDPPAGGDGPALRDFCAEAMARGYFRLPHFARAVLDALQSEDVLVHEPVCLEWLRVGVTLTTHLSPSPLTLTLALTRCPSGAA